MADRVGQQLGHYRLLRVLGKGAFAEVYLAEHLYLERPAAIKVLHVQMEPKTQEQFRREARTIAHLRHPHIVQVLDFGIHDQTPYLVMEYTPGGTLRSHHPKGTRLPLEQIVTYVKQVASALDYAHQQRVIHRDVKPDNLLLNAKDEVLLSDFGLAVVQRSLDSLSMSNPAAGTPLYMAPEQVQRQPCAASDQYALGIIGYEWLAGEAPFRGTLFEVFSHHLSQPPPSLRELLPDLPVAVEEAVFKALAKDPERRFASVADFASALEQACFATQPLTEDVQPPIHHDHIPGAANSKHLLLPRNPYFTGREELLTQLHETLTHTKQATLTQPQAISGLGGIGKTQTALEYAYRYGDDYQYIFWVKAATREELVADLLAIATRLNLPQKDAQDQDLILSAVNHWLDTHSNWLLIFDNADDLALVRSYLPHSTQGHTLLTTRASAMSGMAQKVEIPKMALEEGMLFLLRRTGRFAAPFVDAPPTELATARVLVSEMDGLPLALDQAGAYIEETQCSLSHFLTLYRRQRATILNRRGGIAADHPPVTATWSLSYQKVEQANPAAADLLRLCAFLAPDAIPEELFAEGADELGQELQPIVSDPFELNLTIGELLKYSLVRRDPGIRALIIHRLVQAVLIDAMDEDTQRLWAERTVKVVNHAFPLVQFKTWPRCQRLLPHAQACADLIVQRDLSFPAAARLLNQAGYYLRERAQYQDALPLLQRALAIYEQELGPSHPIGVKLGREERMGLTNECDCEKPESGKSVDSGLTGALR